MCADNSPAPPHPRASWDIGSGLSMLTFARLKTGTISHSLQVFGGDEIR